MSLVKFTRRPWGNLVSSDFLDNDDFFNTSLWTKKLDEPALNIKETDDAYQVELAAPGFSKKDFEVNIDQGCLNISAKNSNTKEEQEDNYTRKEFSYSSFQKSLPLPEDVKVEKIKATFKDGILRFNLEKKEEAKQHRPKVIEVS
tara:strand:+ start:49 stop:483 length:435 start_codon:yes stop_codon:yes gene_type:complete